MIEVIPLKAFTDNYIWALVSKESVYVVDPGDPNPVLSFLEENDFILEGILITHHHFDHTGGIKTLVDKFNVPVFPHAGGVGLCEYVQHLCMIDYVLVNGSKNDKVVEYQDSLHEHFIYPCRIENGNYMPPLDHGYSIEMKEKSVNEFSFPNGEYWKNNI